MTPTRSAPGRRTNVALLVLLPLTALSGLVSNAIGVDWPIDSAAVHGALALAIVVLVPWKARIVARGAAKRRPSRWISYALTVFVLITITSGLIHSHGSIDRLGPLTVMQVHVGGGLLALVAVLFHFRSHPVLPRSADLDRRAALRTVAVGAAASTIWVGWEAGLGAVGAPGQDRRFTGSHETASLAPDRLPVVSWLDDRVQRIDPERWELNIDGERLRLGDIERLPFETIRGTLDCTGGWYSEQLWSGVNMSRLVAAEGARSILVRSATGYARRFPARDLDRLWLATGVGDQPLTAGHGFPARIVAPGRRGFWWVKWVISIETSPVPWWVQLPFPAT